MTLELHFKSNNKISNCVEMLIFKDSANLDINVHVANMIIDKFSIQYGVDKCDVIKLDRFSEADGVKWVSKGRSVENIKTIHDCGVPVVMLFEPMCGNFDTPNNVDFNETKYVSFLVDALLESQMLIVGLYK